MIKLEAFISAKSRNRNLIELSSLHGMNGRKNVLVHLYNSAHTSYIFRFISISGCRDARKEEAWAWNLDFTLLPTHPKRWIKRSYATLYITKNVEDFTDLLKSQVQADLNLFNLLILWILGQSLQHKNPMNTSKLFNAFRTSLFTTVERTDAMTCNKYVRDKTQCTILVGFECLVGSICFRGSGVQTGCPYPKLKQPLLFC